jgi:hypothetical protein
MLKKKYNNICYKSVYILDILEITRRGNITCKNKELNGSVYVDVQFKADCLIYEKNEIIHNCKIVQISDKNIILAKSQHCAIQIKNVSKMDIFKQNEEVPVIVHATRYNLFDTEISVSAIPFVPIPKEIILYRIKPSETVEDLCSDIKDELKEIEKLNNEISKFPPKAIKFFTELIYPFDKYYKYTQCEKLDIVEFVKSFDSVQDDDIIFTGNRYLNEGIIYRVKSADKSAVKSLDKSLEDATEIEITKAALYDRVVFEYKKDLFTLFEFLENYNVDRIKKNSFLWTMYKNLKQKSL